MKNKNILIRRGPTKITAAIIYKAAILDGKRRSQSEIAEITNVSEVTIRNRYREIIEALKIRLE